MKILIALMLGLIFSGCFDSKSTIATRTAISRNVAVFDGSWGISNRYVNSLDIATDLSIPNKETCVKFPKFIITETSERPQLNSENWQACASPGTKTLQYRRKSEVEGEFNLYLWWQSGSSIIDPKILDLYYDVSPPTLTIASLPANIFAANRSIPIRFELMDSGSKVARALYSFSTDDGASFQTEKELTSQDLNIGSFTWMTPEVATANGRLKITAIDVAGNSVSALTSKWSIDLSNAPNAVISLVGPVVSSQTTRQFTMSDCMNIAAVHLSESQLRPLPDASGWQNCQINAGAISYQFTNSVEGTKSIRVWTKNDLGNISAQATVVSITLDQTSPISASNLLWSSAVYSSNSSFTASWSKSVSTDLQDQKIQYFADGSCTAAVGTEIDLDASDTTNAFVAPSEGTYTYKILSLDIGGLQTWSSCSSPAIYDTTVPSGSLVFANGTYSSTRTYNLSYATTDNLSGVDSISLKLSSDGGSTYQDLTSLSRSSTSQAITLPSINATATLRMVILDRAGSAATIDLGNSFVIDNAPPTVSGVTLHSLSPTNQLNTASSIASCSDRSHLLITETASAPLYNSAGWFVCSAVAGALTYTLSSATQGSRTLYVWAKDLADNVSASPATINVVFDNVPPALQIITPATNSTLNQSNIAAVNISGSCSEDTRAVSLSGIISDTITCSGGGWSKTLNMSAVSDGLNQTLTATHTDSAGNAQQSSIQLNIDQTPPSVAVTSPSANVFIGVSTDSSSFSISGTCSENGRTIEVLLDSSLAPGQIGGVCGGGLWSATIDTTLISEGSYQMKARLGDSNGNTTTSNGPTFVRDITAPLAATSLNWTVIQATNSSTITASWVTSTSSDLSQQLIQFYADATCTNSSGSLIGGLSVGTTTRAKVGNSEGSYTYRVISRDQAANETLSICSSPLTVDLTAPVVNSFSLHGGSTATSVNSILTNLSATEYGPGGGTNITHFCLVYNPTSFPNSTDPCWIAVNSPSPGISPSNSISFSNYYYLLGFIGGTYNVFALVKDGAGNVSQISNSPTGTLGTDRHEIVFTPGNPPQVGHVHATSTASPNNPPSSSDLTVTSGSPLTIKWRATDVEGFGTNPIRIFYSVDQRNFTLLASNIANGSNGGCTINDGGTSLDDLSTGCYTLASAPTSSFFAIQVTAVDNSGFISSAYSHPVNVGSFRYRVGRTNRGYGGSGRDNFFWPYHDWADAFAVHPSGKIFIADTQGVGMLDPTDGTYSMLLKNLGYISGDGGPVASASASYNPRIYLEATGNLLVYEWSNIRRIVTSTSPMTVDRVIGGGSTTSAGVTGRNFVIPGGSGDVGNFFAAPNGNIYFVTNEGSPIDATTNPGRIWVYNGTTQLMSEIIPNGSANIFGYTQDIGKCRIRRIVPVYDPSTRVLSSIMATLMATSDSPGSNSCGESYGGSNGEYAVRLLIDPNTGSFQSTVANVRNSGPGPGYREEPYVSYSGTDGSVYVSSYNHLNGIYKYDISLNSWTRVVGNGVDGVCDDGTAATSCALRPTTVVVNPNGRLYFFDRGQVRVLQDNGTVMTLAGRRYGSGSGGAALDTHLTQIGGISSWLDGGTKKLIYTDRTNNLMWESTFGGNAEIIAGNFRRQSADLVTAANSQGLSFGGDIVNSSVQVNPSTGDVFTYRGQDLPVARLVRASGLWSNLGSTLVYGYGSQVIGYSGTKLLMASFLSNESMLPSVNTRLAEVDLTTGVHVSLLGNVSTSNQPNADGNFNCASGTAVIDCNNVRSGDLNIPRIEWDTFTSSWIYKVLNSARIVRLPLGGNVADVVTLPRAAHHFAYRRNSDLSIHKVYYCGQNQFIYEYNINTSTETQLAFGGPDARCGSTTPMYFDSDRNSLVFGFHENNLQAIGEILGL